MEQIYKDWEKSIINSFYSNQKSKSIKLPKNNQPLYACKKKIMIVLNLC